LAALAVPGADEAALNSAVAGPVRRALDRLPEQQRQMLLLAYFGGHTQREIAQITGGAAGHCQVPDGRRSATTEDCTCAPDGSPPGTRGMSASQ